MGESAFVYISQIYDSSKGQMWKGLYIATHVKEVMDILEK